MNKPSYLNHLASSGIILKTADGVDIPVWELKVPEDQECLKNWAHRFRQNYCLDSEIDALREGTGLSRSQYLLSHVFPDETARPGPSIRSGDFAELLISDYVEFIRGYWVPRSKYAEKESRNESAKGADILGFKLIDSKTANPLDELLTYEVKAQLTGNKYSDRLQVAINDSSKDFVRSGISLNAAKRRFVRANDLDNAGLIARFQNMGDRPFIYRCGAAAVLSDDAYEEAVIAKSVASAHLNHQNIELLVIKGNSLMVLAHSIYQKAADEA
jgi:hypothetical protein